MRCDRTIRSAFTAAFRAAALALLWLPLPLLAAVTVTHGDPDRFTDAGDRNNDPYKVVATLAGHLQELGNRYLPAGIDLRIEIHDVDLAGRPRMNLPTEIRVVRGRADPPCIDLSYTLQRGADVAPAKRERICDVNYVRFGETGDASHDPLFFEKRMLDEWFRARFAGGAKP